MRRRLFERSKLRAANDVGGGGCPVRPAQQHRLRFVDQQQQQQIIINNINNNVGGGGCRSNHRFAVIFIDLSFSDMCELPSPHPRPTTTNHKQSQLKLRNSWLRILYKRYNPVVWENDKKNWKSTHRCARLIPTWYLSFFLHRQIFWRIKFTPKKRVNYDKIHSKLPNLGVITTKYTVNCQFFTLNR